MTASLPHDHSSDPEPVASRELVRVGALAALAAAISLLWCFSHGLLLLYGDAVAHLHIARRIFDSRTPGYRQLGAVWLPLSHILLVPFVQKMSWWQNGLAGAWPSMACYIAAVTGMYWLARCWMSVGCAAVAAVFLGLNPGLLYFATTAMTEPLFLAEVIWAALLLVLFARSERSGAARASRLLMELAAVLFCAVFTRYDGWIYAAGAWVMATVAALRRRSLRDRMTGAWVLFTIIIAVAPLLWIGYNARQFGDPLDFLRGQYSARAIEARTTPPGAAHYPGYHDIRVAGLYFLKAAELGAMARPLGKLLVSLALAGSAAALLRYRRQQLWPALLLWLPLPFYAYSVAYGAVPIFIPVWHPFSFYNTRYGMELLPAFALSLAFLVSALAARVAPRVRAGVITAALLLIAGNAAWLTYAGPLVFEEGAANSRSRIPFEQALSQSLEALPPSAPILMYTSDHIGAVEQAGLPLRRTINEGDYTLWQQALRQPDRLAGFAVAVDGDPVAQAIAQHPSALTLLDVVCSTGQPCARMYKSDSYAATPGDAGAGDSITP